MDYPDGYAASKLPADGIRILAYDENDTVFPLKEKCVILVNSTRVIQLTDMRPDNKLLVWHYETAPCAWDVLFFQGETEEYLRLCRDENAMVFHDWSSRDSLNRQFSVQFDSPNYLHIVLPEKSISCKQSTLIADDEMHITWLGRIVPDKIYSIYYIIDGLSRYQTDRKKVMHIIGDGARMPELRAFARRYEKKISFQFTYTIQRENLDSYLVKNTDILFAMGTSVLEGAALGIPSAVVQLDFKCIPDYDFFWLFNTKEYCAGILPEQKAAFDVKYDSMNEILDDIYAYGKKAEYAHRSYLYYKDNFSNYDDLACDFLRYINESSLTFDKLEKCIRYVPYSHVSTRQLRLFGKTVYQRFGYRSENNR